MKGKVYLVGAGPGEAELLTLKGLECLKRADVVIYDRLLDDSLTHFAPSSAEKIYVGKSAHHHEREQKEINDLLVEKARQGKMVVRLKGGDPFLFGRGGEEAEALSQKGIPFEVVPGVSSATAVPAYAGIPLTHRRLSSSLAVVTGHEAKDKATSSIAWDKISGAHTLVFLMGVSGLAHIVERLLAAGKSPSTPAALIMNGTTPNQRVLVATLSDIVAKAQEAEAKPPGVLVVGEVVRLRKQLQWFDGRPLFGKRILVSRARAQSKALSQLLLERGALPIEVPVIKVKPQADLSLLDQAILRLEDYHWVIFTSVNGVEIFFKRLYELGFDARRLSSAQIGAIGPGTASALKRMGVRADCLPKVYSSLGLLAELKGRGIEGKRVLLPRASEAGKSLPSGLISLGAQVFEIKLYETDADRVGLTKLRKVLPQVDVITFTSSSTVKYLVSAVKGVPDRILIACIGPETALAASRCGLRVDIVAKEHTIPGLVRAIEEYFEGGENG